MKKTLITLSILTSVTFANSIDINTLKWTEDFETLVNLSSTTENTLEGLDQNNNGVRDDVEYYVNTKYENKPFQKAMFTKAAKMMQEIIELPTKESAIKTHQQLDHDLLSLYTCRDYMLYRLKSPTLHEELKDKISFKGKVLNTKKRLHAYIKHKELLPFQFVDLDEKSLQEDKLSCLKEYDKYSHKDAKHISSSK